MGILSSLSSRAQMGWSRRGMEEIKRGLVTGGEEGDREMRAQADQKAAHSFGKPVCRFWVQVKEDFPKHSK